MRFLACCTCCMLAFALPATASAWSPLRAENSNVKKGNALMAEEQYGPALEAYDEAAQELPEARGVQLNRGLALLAQDLRDHAKEAFLAAADPSASASTRADAYYDLGIAYARDGEVISQKEQHEQASAQFREAADAFKRALRLRPGDRNAAWNLEYAMRRIREEEQEQQGQQDQDQQQQDQQQQDREQQQDQEQEQPDQGQQDQQQQGQQQDQERPEDREQEQDQEEENEKQERTEQRQEQQRERQKPMPRGDVERFLDALEQNEENLPLQRARRRSAGRPPPEKDW